MINSFFKYIFYSSFINLIKSYEYDLQNAYILIDVQNCFTNEFNEIPIYGSVFDLNTIENEITKNIIDIDQIYVIKDLHNGNEINNKINWIDSVGHHPNDYDIIMTEDIGKKWFPTSISVEYAEEYSNYIHKNYKNPIIMWPNHCINGTSGFNIIPSIQVTLNDWEKISNKKVIIIEKGFNKYSEQYGILPEGRFPIVMSDKDIKNSINEFINILTTYSKITIMGDDFSHSFLSIYRDILEILYDWLKIDVNYLPNIIINNNTTYNFEYETDDVYKWIQDKINNVKQDFLEEIINDGI